MGNKLMNNTQKEIKNMLSPITITTDRLNHMLGVARRCYQLSKDVFGWDEQKSQHMFVMGYLHDVGYEFVRHQSNHEMYGGNLLSAVNFKYAEEIRQHGSAKHIAKGSKELLLLNYADMTTSATGEQITIQERLKGIRDRYGKDSEQYLEAKDLVKELTNKLAELNLKL